MIAESIYQGRTIDVRNLIYHICPLRSNDEWRLNVAEIRRRWHVFNGRKIIAVVCGTDCHDIGEVRREIGNEDWILITRPNDPELREVATFLPLLETIQSTSHQEATFYAHTKGISSDMGFSGPRAWRDAMYHFLLDQMEVVREGLLNHPCVGTTKIVWPDGMTPPYPSRLKHGHWMFAGTFFWFRHDAVFRCRDWAYIPRDRYAAEAWLSGLFCADQGLTLYQPWPVEHYPTPSPYDATLYHCIAR